MECEIEAGEIRPDHFNDVTTAKMSSCDANPCAESEKFGSPRCESSPEKKDKLNTQIISPENIATASVSNCYVFKSRLQEYAQRAGLTIPFYDTIKEGPSHEPFFRSTVILNNVRYDSLPGFFNRKAAEQSAAEVALIELSKSAETKFGISAPVHETGLCKNLLQEYAQKMNYAVPLYECVKDGNHGKNPTYSCTVEIGNTRYVGASAGTKKEAEIKAARTALLAIQSASSEECMGNSVYTVIPQKKRSFDLEISTKETAAALKPKKNRFKKHSWRKMRAGLQKHRSGQGTMDIGMEVNTCNQDQMESTTVDVSCAQKNTADEMTIQMVGQGGVEVGKTDGDQQNTVDGMTSQMFEQNTADGMPVQLVEQNTADGMTVQMVDQYMADGMTVQMVEQGGVELGITDDGSHEKTTYYGSEVKTDPQSVTEPSLTNYVVLQRKDSGLDPRGTITSGGASSQEMIADGSDVKKDSRSVTEQSVSNCVGLQSEESEHDPMRTKTSEGVYSQEMVADGSEVKKDSQSIYEANVTNFLGIQREDFEHNSEQTKASVFEPVMDNKNLDNSSVLPNAVGKDGESVRGETVSRDTTS